MLIALFVSTTGCANKELHSSIEKMNEGIRMATAKRYAEAITSLERATHIYPKNHQAWYTLGEVYGIQEKWDKAASAYSEAIKYRTDDAMYYMKLGIALYESKKKNEAEQHLKKAADLNPELYKVYWYLGRIYRDGVRPAEAAEAWTRACKFNPRFGQPFVRLGELYWQWGFLDQAISVLRQGAKHALKAKDLSNIHYYLGLAYGDQSKWKQAVESFTTAAEKSSANVEALFQRGKARQALKDKSKAQKDFEAFLKKSTGMQKDGIEYLRQEANTAIFQLLSDG